MVLAQFILFSLADTASLAQRIVTSLSGQGVLALMGSLGSGKTAFTQQLGQVVRLADKVTSPTFTLVNEYHYPNGLLVHGDLYRLAPQEIVALGIGDYFTQPNTLTVIEWADRNKKIFPSHTIWLDFELIDDYRVVTITSQNRLFWNKFEAFSVPHAV